MRRPAALVILVLLACGEPATSDEPSPSQPAAASPAAAPAAPVPSAAATPVAPPVAPDPFEVPPEWVWVTDTKGAFEVAMPTLPRARTQDQRMLLSQRGPETFSVASSPVTPENNLADLMLRVRGPSPAPDEAPWREHGLAFSAALPGGVSRFHMIELEGRLYTLDPAGPISPRDVEIFLHSFSARTTPRPVSVHDPEKGYRIEAPAAMGRWRDLGGIPPLAGHRGLLDGHQFSISDTDLLFVPNTDAALEGAVDGMLRELRATLVEINSSPLQGRPSRRLELRADDGMYATIRLVMNGTRLVQAAVYAPSGREAPWADAYVDSLAIESTR